MNINKIRKDFKILNRKVNGKKLIYFDNAATSLKPKQVIDAQNCYYEKSCANIHRGLHSLSEEASIIYENAHKKVANFINSKENEVIFTKNTTESINLIAYSLMNGNYFKKGDLILLSEMEHHSNIIPWQYLTKKLKLKLEFVDIDENFNLDMNDFEKKVKDAKLVSISGASNTIATHPDLKSIEKITHNEGALLCVDGAQLVPHTKIDFKKLNIDFLTFSGHKMLAPTGIGCLIGKQKVLDNMEPFLMGGDMITSVTKQKSEWNKLPTKFEAGTPNIAGAYGLSSAIDYLNKIGFENIKKQNNKLTTLAINELEKINVKMYCPKTKNQGPIIMFDNKNLDCHDLALLLNDEGIAIRSGMHCAQPIVSKYNKDGLARISFYFYNTSEEVEYFINKLKKITKLTK